MNSEDLLLEKMQQFSINKNKNYVEQIEKSLQSLSELFHSCLPKKKLSYKIKSEHKDVLIVELDKDGEIKVNQTY